MRQAGTSAPKRARQRGQFGNRNRLVAEIDAISRSAAAASAEPPPIPAATGRFLRRVMARLALDPAGPALAEGGDGAGDEIGVAIAQRLGEGAGDHQRVGLGLDRLDLVGEIGEDHEAFEIVIAIVAPARHMQRQIDLGGGRLEMELGHQAAAFIAVAFFVGQSVAPV